MSYVEKLTIRGKTIVFNRPHSPVEVESVSGEGMSLRKIRVTDPSLVPTNFDKPEGTPMTIYRAEDDSVRVDLSKRTKEAMSFWHRNADYDELIFCFKGSIIWETELGRVELKAGEMFVIPRGIAHRAIPGPNEDGENVIIELKVAQPLRCELEDVQPKG